VVLGMLVRAVRVMGRAEHTVSTPPPKNRASALPLGGAVDCVSPRLFDVDAAASYLSVSVDVVRRLVADGTIKRVRLPSAGGYDLRRVLVDRRDLDALVDGSK
jgi:excisionase family DNA binding protein